MSHAWNQKSEKRQKRPISSERVFQNHRRFEEKKIRKTRFMFFMFSLGLFKEDFITNPTPPPLPRCSKQKKNFHNDIRTLPLITPPPLLGGNKKHGPFLKILQTENQIAVVNFNK